MLPCCPFGKEVVALLTGNGTINYDAGDTNLESDLNIAGAANTFEPKKLNPFPAFFSTLRGLPQADFAICTSALLMGESSMASGTPASSAADV